MENKNTIIALVLMLVVWVGFTLYSQTQVDQAPGSSESAISTENQAKAEISPSPEPKIQADVFPGTGKISKDVKVREITVETDNFIAVFSNVGANLKSFQLKKYKETAKEGEEFIRYILENDLPEKFYYLNNKFEQTQYAIEHRVLNLRFRREFERLLETRESLTEKNRCGHNRLEQLEAFYCSANS